jgi:acetyltransferase-like isoleucine patch superfamily enzyme
MMAVFKKVVGIAYEEVSWIGSRLWVLNALLRGLPSGACGYLRASLYRAFGLSIGHGTKLYGAIDFANSGGVFRNIRIGNRCFLNSHVFLDASAPVTIGNGVSIGHHVCIITAHHEIGPAVFRAGPIAPRPVTIDNGAWIAAGATILPGVAIGAGAVVASGAVVTRDVPPHTLVAGMPARIIRHLEP